MSKERGFFRRHKITTGVLFVGAWRSARWWKRELKKLPYQGPDNRMHNPSTDNPDEFEHERARPAGVSKDAQREEMAEEGAMVPDNDLNGLSDSASLFGEGGLGKFIEKTS